MHLHVSAHLRTSPTWSTFTTTCASRTCSSTAWSHDGALAPDLDRWGNGLALREAVAEEYRL